MTWHRLDHHHQPVEHQLAEVLRIFGMDGEMNTAYMAGRMILTRPDLGHEGWALRQHATDVHPGEVWVPDGFPRHLTPTTPGDHIFWRPLDEGELP